MSTTTHPAAGIKESHIAMSPVGPEPTAMVIEPELELSKNLPLNEPAMKSLAALTASQERIAKRQARKEANHKHQYLPQQVKVEKQNEDGTITTITEQQWICKCGRKTTD